MARSIADLEQEIEELRFRVEELEAIVGISFVAPPQFHLSRYETILFGLLMSQNLVTKEGALSAMYLHQQDEPEIKIVDVFICKLRKKLKPFSIEIQTQWGQGYFLTPANKAIVQYHLDQLRAA